MFIYLDNLSQLLMANVYRLIVYVYYASIQILLANAINDHNFLFPFRRTFLFCMVFNSIRLFDGKQMQKKIKKYCITHRSALIAALFIISHVHVVCATLCRVQQIKAHY